MCWILTSGFPDILSCAGKPISDTKTVQDHEICRPAGKTLKRLPGSWHHGRERNYIIVHGNLQIALMSQ